jgi:hypothetical protein
MSSSILKIPYPLPLLKLLEVPKDRELRWLLVRLTLWLLAGVIGLLVVVDPVLETWRVVTGVEIEFEDPEECKEEAGELDRGILAFSKVADDGFEGTGITFLGGDDDIKG